MRKIGLILIAICMVVTFSSSVRGAEMPITSTMSLMPLNIGSSAFLDAMNRDVAIYNDCPIRKAGDGAMNALSSWTDIPTEVAYQTEDTNILLGLTVGLGRGIVFGVTRGAAGLVDVGTSPFPPYDQPLMEPEYTVKNPDKDGFKIALLEW